MKRLETNRLILRKPMLKDINDFFKYAKRDTIGPMAGWMPHKSIIESEYILRDFIEKKEVYAIVDKENNKMIGTVGLHEVENEPNAKEIGYALNDDYRGKGLVVEATNELIKYLFTEKNSIDLLYCGHFAHNNASRRVIEKLGFNLYKIMVDEKYIVYADYLYLYKLSKEEYLRRNY